MLASLDSPGGWSGTAACLELRVLADRRCRSGPSGGLVVAVFIESWEKPPCVRTSTRTQIITCCSRLTCSGSSVCRRLVAGILLARLLAFCCLTVICGR